LYYIRGRLSMQGPDPSRFAPALLGWYDQARRDLPWRRQSSPYRTLLSELMLQQTVVATVVPYFERFVARLPTLAALAAADEADVLALWSGLGYYRRARNLHAAARAVVERHGGALPADEAVLRTLPGIGPYTAAAIASIAFGARTFPLDGNGARVMARLHGVDEPIDRPAVRERLRALGQALTPAARPGDFAQAVMELGALVCAPSTPRCEGCPVASACVARAEGRQALLPLRLPRAAKRAVRLVCAAVERRGKLLLVRRAAGTLLAGTWTLPSAEVAEGESDAAACARALAEVGLAGWGRALPAGEIRHVFTHRDVAARVFRLGARGRLRGDARWVGAADLPALAISSFTRKTLALAPRPGGAQRRVRMASRSTT
jgi:A/G-specific adenine glycosylase